jgi:hypothetical protein
MFQYPGQRNERPPEYEAGVPTTRQQRSAIFTVVQLTRYNYFLIFFPSILALKIRVRFFFSRKC